MFRANTLPETVQNKFKKNTKKYKNKTNKNKHKQSAQNTRATLKKKKNVAEFLGSVPSQLVSN